MRGPFTKIAITLLACSFVLLQTSCTRERAPLGSEKNPIKFFFVPSVDVKVLEDSSKVIKAYLEANTDWKFKVSIPANYVAVVEALGTERADIASLNTFGYILAHDKYKAHARLTVVRYGKSTYQSQIITHVDNNINSLADITGKKVAFVDPASASGYLLPLKLFKEKNIKPSETMFAMRHDNVVSMIYQNQVDAGATFYSPVEEGKIQDARRLVKTQYPDVEEKIKIVKLTEPIPNDPIVFRDGMDEAMVKKVIDTMKVFITTEEGKTAFKNSLSVTSFVDSTDADYDAVRIMLKTIGKSADEMLK